MDKIFALQTKIIIARDQLSVDRAGSAGSVILGPAVARFCPSPKSSVLTPAYSYLPTSL